MHTLPHIRVKDIAQINATLHLTSGVTEEQLVYAEANLVAC